MSEAIAANSPEREPSGKSIHELGRGPVPEPCPEPDLEPSLDSQRLPLLARIYGVLVLLDGLVTLALFALATAAVISSGLGNDIALLEQLEPATLTFIFACVEVAVLFFNALGLTVLGMLILRNRRRHAARWAYVLMVPTILDGLLQLALNGLSAQTAKPLIQLALLVAISITADPGLREERRLQRALKRMEDRDDYEEAVARGMVGRDLSGKGYAALDFFNIVWIFFAGCLAGWVIEFFYVGLLTGTWQNRAGMIYGPLSPIYGFGACLLTICLNRLYKLNFVFIFFASAVIGGAFEWTSSWFLEKAFGIVSWDYTGQWLSIGGRTSGKYMCFWGLLGLLWLKVIEPRLIALINRIPWQWRYSLTLVVFVLLFVDGLMTLMAFDCWYTRSAGMSQDSPVMQFFARHYPNEWMEQRLPGMSMHPDVSVRV